MSACFACGLASGDPIKVLTLRHGTPALWQGLPVLVVVLVGGFATNFIWCVILLIRNKTGHQFFNSHSSGLALQDEAIIETSIDAPSREVVKYAVSTPGPQGNIQLLEATPVLEETDERAPMLVNYLLCALAGTTWYFQFFFYTMGETQMGRYRFSSWTLHMASIIIFSSLWGIGFKEWKGAGSRSGLLLTLALFLLVASTMIVGYGNYLGLAAK
jgi:L-rhamnose-H+ transport protein